MNHPLEDAKELRALYDVRIKELHHFSTTIWAFPTAFAALLAAECRFLSKSHGLLIVAALFNVALFYAFWKHLHNRQCVLNALQNVEAKMRAAFGGDVVPDFKACPWYLRVRATEMMKWVVGLVSVAFLVVSVFYPSVFPTG